MLLVYTSYFQLEKDDHRSEFVSSAKSLIKQHGFDGLDLAWEFPVNKAKKDRGTIGRSFVKYSITIDHCTLMIFYKI